MLSMRRVRHYPHSNPLCPANSPMLSRLTPVFSRHNGSPIIISIWCDICILHSNGQELGEYLEVLDLTHSWLMEIQMENRDNIEGQMRFRTPQIRGSLYLRHCKLKLKLEEEMAVASLSNAQLQRQLPHTLCRSQVSQIVLTLSCLYVTHQCALSPITCNNVLYCKIARH